MTIDDLKTLMDEFDPAALLPELDSIVGRVELAMRIAILVGPIILLVMALLYIIASPKEANYHFGYRCYFGMGSVNAWRFSQRIAGMVWGLLGLGLTVVMLLKSGSVPDMEVMDMVLAAVRCLLWEAGLILVSCLVINTIVALCYDGRGERRKKKDRAK